MGLRFQCICVDSDDPVTLGRWWADALGWRWEADDDGDEVAVEPPVGDPHSPSGQPDILFLKVPETKSIKNRLHIHLRPQDQDAEVARRRGHGRRPCRHRPRGPNVGRARRSQGNEFCVLRAFLRRALWGSPGGDR